MHYSWLNKPHAVGDLLFLNEKWMKNTAKVSELWINDWEQSSTPKQPHPYCSNQRVHYGKTESVHFATSYDDAEKTYIL